MLTNHKEYLYSNCTLIVESVPTVYSMVSIPKCKYQVKSEPISVDVKSHFSKKKNQCSLIQQVQDLLFEKNKLLL